ncbi:MAG: type IV pilus modification protein PilV [Candidatus Competibacteraceae bacterium]|nr:type IV pilus modification protein PilV [Candidatus Competibacteraceae bacterium]
MRKQTGFTLIEILVTVVVLAIGLLGLAGLQATALRFNSSASQRSQATILAYDIMERIRANSLAARCGAYGGTPEVGLDCTSVTLAETTIANNDIAAWNGALLISLPSPNGVIAYDGGTRILTITIQWDDDRDGVLDQPFLVTTQL